MVFYCIAPQVPINYDDELVRENEQVCDKKFYNLDEMVTFLRNTNCRNRFKEKNRKMLIATY